MNHHHQEKENLKRSQKKENLINNLKNETFCKIGVSDISGVGVMAIKDISEGAKIFECCNDDLNDPIEINEEDLRGVGEPILKYAKNFLVQSGPNTYPFPAEGLNSIGIIFYLNHSDNPNTEFFFDGNLDGFVSFITSRKIEKGEELTQDYNNLSNNKEELIKQFPFLRQQKVKL
jgi:hypothetical protein